VSYERVYLVCASFLSSSSYTQSVVAICSVAAESDIVAWDCKDGEEVMLIPYELFVAGDNPMQAEECSHAGLNCNYYCRTCDVGGVETQFSTGWYWPILQLMTTGLHSTTSPSCTQDTFPHLHDAFLRSRLVRIVAHLRVLLHIFVFLRIFAFHCASSC
jgi:hypothetical protein